MALSDVRFAISNLFRPGRMRVLARAFDLPQARVLDIGGTHAVWSLLPRDQRPRLTILNLDPRPAELPDDIAYVQGTALDLPFSKGDFDLVFSNSVIEHVGDWEDQKRFAAEVRRLDCPFFVQTPNRYFPVEPHYLGLGVQFLPRALARPALRYSTVWGLSVRPERREIDCSMDHVRLLTVAEMTRLFPDAELWRETLFGLTKSVIAVSGAVARDAVRIEAASLRGPESSLRRRPAPQSGAGAAA